ncbi:MAG: hypothetical protein C0601_08915 [Candidatus Muiribacterium halophilum]|uniref:Uncharacterized protein n=1 Tax=Muiribacterium halophilum TaxID=2053465 RepID=A0A2N5ZE53_MUIH1|nr:MAG: hypothetical protein C0601_08915 [Candidatus Muirbacterium halophilum]
MGKSKSNILIIAPCYSVNRPPLGISLLSGFLKERRFDCKTIDLNAECYLGSDKKHLWEPQNFYKWIEENSFYEEIFIDIKDLIDNKVDYITTEAPDVVGLSVFSTNIFCSLYIAKRLKEKNDNIKIVFGGPHMKSFVGGKNEKFFSVADFIVYSEGEQAYLDIVKGEKRPSGVIAKDKLFETEVSYIDGKDFPMPDLDLFRENQYKLKNSFSYMYGRGCPNECAYCEETNIYRGYRHVNEKEFKRHLKIFKNQGIKTLYFSDSQVNPSEKIFNDFICSLEDGLRYQGNLFAFDWVKRKHISDLSSKGFEKITIGVESCSKRILRRMNKPLSVIKVLRILKWAKDHNIKVKLNFIVGFPSEKWSDVLWTMFFILVFSYYSPQISPVASTCSALSGSRIYKKPDEYFIKHLDTIDLIEENGNDIVYREKKKKVFNAFIFILKKIGILPSV